MGRTQQLKREQVMMACLRCQNRKVKCDSGRPRCGPCDRAQVQCAYTPRRREWLMQYMSRALQRIDHYEKALYTIMNDHHIINGDSDGSPTWLFAKFGLQDAQIPKANRSSDLFGFQTPGCNATKEPYFMAWDLRFSFAQRLPVSCTDFSRAFDNHIIILAVTQGWAIARQCFFLDQQWNAIETSDAELIRYCSFAERFAFLWVLRSNLKALSQRVLADESKYCQEKSNAHLVPTWLAPCTTQLSTPHPQLLDYIPWPALRDRVIGRQEKYCTDRFMKPYVKSIRFRWPHPWETAVTAQHDGAMLRLTEEFQQRLMDISCWAFNADFISIFPEIVSDVTIFEPSPLHLLSFTTIECSERPSGDRGQEEI